MVRSRSDPLPEFRERYREELAGHAAKVQELRGRARREVVTILYAARDREQNDAVVVVELLDESLKTYATAVASLVEAVAVLHTRP